ncbi:MAG: hypothetical protein IK990_16700 [Ruminiclostridium sp.]|nr:hypothetical protein [Ruminiclostridium sp.]
MINVLLNELGCGKDKINRFTQGVLGFGKKAVKILTDSAIGGEAAEIVGKVFSDNSFNYVEEIEKLKKEFQNSINEKMKKAGKSRIVIFIDDLDRLQPLRAVELLEVLKLFLDCKNVVFVLAVDCEIVTLGIRQKFGNNVDEEKGRSFFDKIIQLPFTIPVSNYDITNYIRNMLVRFDISTDDKEIEYYKDFRKLVSFRPSRFISSSIRTILPTRFAFRNLSPARSVMLPKYAASPNNLYITTPMRDLPSPPFPVMNNIACALVE